MTTIHRTLIIGCSAIALGGCGADEIVSPGTSGDVNVTITNPPAPAPTPTPAPTSSLVTPAAGCPTIAATGGLTDGGTIQGPTGTYRVCQLPALVDADSTLPFISGIVYAIPGRVDIGTDQGAASTGSQVELTVEPGVILYGSTGRSFLVANRGNQLLASGTADRPIIFTSRDNIQGLSNDTSIGQWGGIVLLGRAPVSDCRTGVINPADQNQCEQELEGTNVTTLFGGSNAGDSSGRLEYVQIRYSGFSLAPGRELQSLTTGGTGSGTVFNYIQTHNSSDDGMEFFGGSVNMKYVVVTGADDDSLDVDSGAQANLQYVIAAQRTAGGDNLIELDSPDSDFSVDARPRTVFQLANFTFIERSTANSQVVRARGGGKLVLANGVIDTDTETCIRIDEAATLAADPVFQSVVGDCDQTRPFQGSSGVTDDQVRAEFAAGSNTDANFTITLGMSFVNGSGEAGIAAFDVTSLSSFFDATSYIGAVENAGDTWYRDWTCNSSILTFGSTTGACTSLPTYPAT